MATSSSSAPAAPSSMPAGAREALAKWEQENQIQEDQRYKFDLDRYAAIREARPWRQDPIYFKKVRISAVALIKMAMHAVSGDNLEIMGLLVGFVEGDTIFVVDSFELPVVGIEYQVNPGAKCDIFLTQFRELNERIGKNFATIGWYHSHPGFNCFLSKTDCETQTLYQTYQDPFVAVVVDPKKTMHTGKVEIGAFRCYPAGYEPPEGEVSKFRIPLDRVEDFGAQANKFYPLEHSVYKSTTETQMMELLWTQYWLKTLCASPLIVGRDLLTSQISNLTLELAQAETKLVQHGRRGYALPSDKKEESVLQDVAEESADRTTEIVQGLLSQVIKDTLFNRPR